jgi:ferrous iron transport protein A
MKLKDMRCNDRAKVVGYDDATENAYDETLEYLLVLGLTQGTVITLRKIAPMGDPVVIQVGGYSLSLRKYEADCLLLERA